MQFSKQTVELLNELLNEYNLPAKHPNFVEFAAIIAKAKDELNDYFNSEDYKEKDTK